MTGWGHSLRTRNFRFQGKAVMVNFAHPPLGLTSKSSNRAQAGIRLLVQPISVEVPLNANEQELVAHVVPVACRAPGEVSFAQLGHVLEAAVGGKHLGHSPLKCSMDDCEIRPSAEF